MILTQSFFASVVAATTLAFPSLPRVFFANVKDTILPLSGKFLGEELDYSTAFVYGDPAAKPVEFFFDQGYAFTKQEINRQFVGFHEDELVFGPKVQPLSLEFDSSWRVISGSFYMCELVNDSARWILRRTPGKTFHHCFEADIYLLPYNRQIHEQIRPYFKSRPEQNSLQVNEASPSPKACSIHYHGKNAHEKFILSSFEKKCDIYINGKLQPKDVVSKLGTST